MTGMDALQGNGSLGRAVENADLTPNCK